MKYVDVDLLREKIAEQIESLPREVGRGAGTITSKGYGMMQAFQIMRSIIDSLQQEQPNDLASLISEATTVAKRIVDRDSFYNSLPQNLRNKYTFNAWCEILEALSMMKKQEQSEPVKGKFVFPKFLYARTLDNKTIDVSYVPQSMEAIEYVHNDYVEEQPEVDLKKEIKEWVDLMVGASFPEQDGDFISEEDYRSVIRQTAYHFYELGLNARKEKSK